MSCMAKGLQAVVECLKGHEKQNSEEVNMAKVTAKFIFELPFYIIVQGDYSSSPQSLKTNSEEIVVYAPALFDLRLSDKPLRGSELEYPYLIGKVNDEPIWKSNCIPIDIRRDFPTIPIADEDQEALVAKAREILSKILTLCRWRGKQLHIAVTDIEQFNYHLRYFDAADNPINAGPQGVQATGASYLTLPGPLLKSNEWNDICQDLVSGTMPELYENLLIDAYSVVSREPRRAILDAATACEVFIENFCETASKNDPEVDPVVYSALTQRARVLSYFHEVLRYLFKHSLKEKKTDLYRELDYLVGTNNFVKHEGLCQYKNDKGVVIPVDSTRARDFIQAVEEAIKYTKSLGC